MAAGVALLVPLLGRGRHPVDLALVVLPLTLLAGPAIARALRPIRLWRDDPEPWLLAALSLVLLSTAALCLPSAWTPANNAEWRQLYTGIGIVTAVLAVLVWVAYGVFGNWRTVGQARAGGAAGLRGGLGRRAGRGAELRPRRRARGRGLDPDTGAGCGRPGEVGAGSFGAPRWRAAGRQGRPDLAGQAGRSDAGGVALAAAGSLRRCASPLRSRRIPPRS